MERLARRLALCVCVLACARGLLSVQPMSVRWSLERWGSRAYMLWLACWHGPCVCWLLALRPMSACLSSLRLPRLMVGLRGLERRRLQPVRAWIVLQRVRSACISTRGRSVGRVRGQQRSMQTPHTRLDSRLHHGAAGKAACTVCVCSCVRARTAVCPAHVSPLVS